MRVAFVKAGDKAGLNARKRPRVLQCVPHAGLVVSAGVVPGLDLKCDINHRWSWGAGFFLLVCNKDR